MIRCTGYLLCVILNTSTAFAQQYFPYLTAEGRYAISDSEGIMIDSRRYDLVDFVLLDPDYLWTSNGGKYGLCSANTGQEILEPSLDRPPLFGEIVIRQSKDGRLYPTDTLRCAYSGNTIIAFDPSDLSREVVVAEYGSYKTQSLVLYAAPEINYVHNLWPFKRKGGLVNFYHKDGYVLLQNDIINGNVLTPTMLVAEGENGLLALMNTSGLLKTPYLFKEVAAIGDNHFLVKTRQSPSTENALPYDWAGVFTADGEISIDTIYTQIITVDDETVIVRHGDLYGLMHVSGQSVYPVTYEKITSGANGHVIVNDKSSARICDTQGRILYTCLAGQCKYSTASNTYLLKDSLGVSKVLSENLETLYTGTAHRVSPGLTPDRLLIDIGNNETIEVSDGYVKPFEKGTSVSQFSTDSKLPYYMLYRKGTYGLINGDFEPVIPLRYSEIRYYDDVDRLLAKTPSGWYFVYDRSGVLLSKDSIPSPDFRNPLLTFKVRQEGEDHKIILRDGRIWDFPGFKIVGEIFTHSRKQLYKCIQIDGDYCYLLNDQLYNIVPEGYYLKERFYKRPHVQLGLIPVFDEFQSGVINDLGEWEIPPSEHSYVPMSDNVIIRYYGLPETESKEGMDVFLRTPEGWISQHYQSVRYFSDSQQIRVALRDPETGRFLYGVIDTLGNIIAPVKYQEIEIAKQMIIGRLQNADDTWNSIVLDPNGNVMCTLPYKVSAGNEYLTITDPLMNVSGAANLSGTVLIPPKYNDFKYFPDAGMISYSVKENKDHTTYLAEMDGEVLASAKTFNFQKFGEKENYRLLAWNYDSTHIFSGDHSVNAVYAVKFVKTHHKLPGLLHCETKDGKPVWVQLQSGRCFMD